MKREAAATAMTGMMTTLPGALQARATATGIPDRSRTCGIVFDPDSPPGPNGVDPGRQAVAGLPGLWASHGIDVDHRRFVAVLHAATTELALDAAVHAQRASRTREPQHRTDAGPAGQEGGLRRVEAARVAIRTIDPDALRPLVRIGPTANLVFIDLETRAACWPRPRASPGNDAGGWPHPRRRQAWLVRHHPS